MLEAPPAWNDVPDLMMEAEEGRILPKAAVKRKREVVARGRRKQQRDEEISLEKHEHSPMVSRRTRNSAGFYSEHWDDLQQQDDECQVPDK